MCLSFAWVGSTHAQADVAQLPLEQLMQMEVRTASRYLQSALEAPAAVSVVTAEDIRTFGYRNLAEVLAGMRGLYMSYDRSYHYLGMRGFSTPGDYNTRVLLLVDGVRFNDNLYDQAPVGTDFPIDIDLIERVEFVPGPSAAVYGANAFFGVINIITRTGRQLQGAQVSTELGSHGHARLRFTLGTADGYGGDWLVSASRSTTRGEDLYFPAYDTSGQNHGLAQRLDYDRSSSLFVKMRREGVTLSLSHGERAKGLPTAAFSQVFNDPRSRVADSSTRMAAEYAGQWSPALHFTARLHGGQYRYVGDYVYDYPPVTANRDIGRGRWLGSELQWVSTAFQRHKISFGLDYRRDLDITQRNLDLAPEAILLDKSSRGDVLGIYLQDEVALRPDLVLHAGLRWGKHSDSKGSLHPRLGLVYLVGPATALKLLYGTAYRPPNAYERDYRVETPGGVVGTDRLRPERIRTTELVLEHAPSGASRALVTLFQSRVSHLLAIGDAPQPDRLMFSNAGNSVGVYGVETEVEQRLGPDARLRLAYSWQRARDTLTRETLANSPRHLLKAQWSTAIGSADAAPFARGRLGLEAIGIGARNTLASRLPAHAVANLTYTTRLASTEVSFGVYNLLDRRYADPASFEIRGDSILQDGRTLRLKLTHAF